MARSGVGLAVLLIAALCALVLVVVATTMRDPAAAPAPGTAPDAASPGPPQWSDEFAGSALDPAWEVYDSAGHDDNGERRPSQVTVADGVMTQTGTADARSAGMVLQGRDARYGRWDVRFRAAPTADPVGVPYHFVVALLPVGVPYAEGERDIDFAEGDVGSGTLDLFVHHPRNKQDYAEVPLDVTAWHSVGVEITPDHLTWFVDGVPTITDTRPEALPQTPLSLNVQLDANAPRGLAPAVLQLDWVRYQRLPTPRPAASPAPAPAQGDYDPSS